MITMQGNAALAAARTEAQAMRDRLADFPALHRRVGDALLDWAQRNFAAEGALLEDFPSGWPALSPATLASRRRRGRGTRMLYGTGRLAAGFTIVPGATGVTLDNAVPYAAAHLEGRGVPRRPIFPNAPQAERLAHDAATEHVKEALR
jgi:phage gpG-like protein